MTTSPKLAPAVNRAEVQAALKALFPSSSVDEGTTDAVLSLLQKGPAAALGARLAESDPTISYYMANADHKRSRGTNSQFIGHLPLVRVRLPETGTLFGDDVVPNISTAIGIMLPNDRKIASVEMAEQLTGQSFARVDLLTPVRSSPKGARFGAVATYLGYAQVTDPAPTSFILEAGTATGEAMVLFASQGMNPIINQQTQYQPTPFSKPTNWYSGWLTMNANDPNEPETLVVTSTDTSTDPNDPDVGQTPYIQITLSYQKLAAPPSYNPTLIILEAAARIGIIARAMNFSMGSSGIPEDIAAVLLGWDLDWVTKPGS